MARYGRVGAAPRIMVLMLLVFVLLAGGLLWFDYLGIIDAKDRLAPVLKFVGIRSRSKVESPESEYLLDLERIGKLKEAVELQAEDAKKVDESLKSKEKEIDQKSAEIEERKKAIQDQEKSFNERVRLYDNKKTNIEENAKKLNGMPPAQAVAILLKMDDQDMIDHLRTVELLAKAAGEDSVVAYWLSLMPPERSAVIMRKMAVKPQS